MKTIEEMKSFPAARKNCRPEKVEKLSEEQMKWFRDAKFGMFIHWGVYSMLGKGEWVLMNEHLDVRKYETLKDDFLAENFDAEQWAKNAKAAGMKYMVLTTRHHDGFCLFDSKCSDFTAMKGATMSTLYTAQTKAELERVLGIMKPYIDECVCYDVVYSPKFGYLLIDLPGHDTIDDAEVVPLDDAATLLHKLFINLAYDFMEKNGHCTDYIEATDLEKYALRIWMKKYIDQLPEYRYILDNILRQ